MPSVTQIGKAPILITKTTLTGIDDFTSSVVTDTENARDTKLITETDFDLVKDANVVH